MSVQTSNSNKVLSGKGATVYLMELRRRLAETNARRQKLEVLTWERTESNTIPIRRRQERDARRRGSNAGASEN
jgi:hypothetical protein